MVERNRVVFLFFYTKVPPIRYNDPTVRGKSPKMDLMRSWVDSSDHCYPQMAFTNDLSRVVPG